MASLTRKQTSQYWFAAFRDRNGKQHRVSTRETRKSVAQKIADKYELAATRRTSRKALWATLNELQTLVGGDETPNATVKEFLELWLSNRKAEGITKSTYDCYEHVIRRFLSFLGETRLREGLITVTKRDIEWFRNLLVDQKLSPSSVNRNLRVLRMVWRTARLDGYIFDDPTETVRPVKGSNGKSRRPFTLEEIRAVLEKADPEWQSLIKLGLYTGHRLGDLALLRWENADLASGRLSLVTRKTGTDIKLPIAGPLKEHLLSLDSSDDLKAPLHPRAYAVINDSGRVAALSAEFADLLVQAGLRAGHSHQGNGRGHCGPRTSSELTFHSLRHTAVSLLKNSGVPHSIAQALVGHESQAISQQYTHVGDQALSEALQKLPVL